MSKIKATHLFTGIIGWIFICMSMVALAEEPCKDNPFSFEHGSANEHEFVSYLNNLDDAEKKSFVLLDKLSVLKDNLDALRDEQHAYSNEILKLYAESRKNYAPVSASIQALSERAEKMAQLSEEVNRNPRKKEKLAPEIKKLLEQSYDDDAKLK